MKELGHILGAIQKEKYRSERIGKQRSLLIERIGTGQTKPVDRPSTIRIKHVKERVARSKERTELHARQSQEKIVDLFKSVGEQERYIPLPLQERHVFGLLAITTDPNTTIQQVKDLLNLNRDKKGKKALSWQHSLYALNQATENLYRRLHIAHGAFATEDEKTTWNAISAWVNSKQDANIPPLKSHEIYREFRENYLPEWFKARKSETANLAIATSPALTQIERPGTETIIFEPGKIYIIAVNPAGQPKSSIS